MLVEKIGVKEVKALKRPKENSHKGDNGKVLIIGGSQHFHGAPIFAAKTASRIVDLVYFSSVPENNEIIKKMKAKLADFIAVDRTDIFEIIKKVDVVLIGPGLGVSKETAGLTNRILQKFKTKKFVLDADALKVLDKKLLNRNCVVIPHCKEFRELFKITPTKQNVIKVAKKYKCVVVLKGQADLLADEKQFKVNTTGNAGMTKGGTGDVLAGLIAGLAAKNKLFLAACAGVFINGLAGDRLKQKVSYYYNASDLVEEIPRTIFSLII